MLDGSAVSNPIDPADTMSAVEYVAAATLRFGAPDGLFRFVFRDENAKYTQDLKHALEKNGVSFEDLHTIDEVREKIR